MTEVIEVDVAIVGAGIGGLATAEGLHAHGHTVAVLDARDRVGGRIHTVGELDLGATWFWDSEERVGALLHRLGLTPFPQHLAGDTMFDDGRGGQRIPGNVIDGPAWRYPCGAATLTSGLADMLPDGSVHLDQAVTRIEEAAGDRIQVTTRSRCFSARHVVLAVPPALAVDAIDFVPGLPTTVATTAAATPVWMGQAIKVVAAYDTPFWRTAGLAGAAMSRSGPLQEIHDMSGLDGTPAALFGFAHTSTMRPGFEDDVRRQLVRLFGEPAGEPRSITVHDWSRDRWTVPPGAADNGNYGLFGHNVFQRSAMGDRLHWASTETASACAGHVEGALVAAERCVAAIRALHTALS